MVDGIAAVAALWLLVVASLGHMLDSWCGAAVCREAALRSNAAVRRRVTNVVSIRALRYHAGAGTVVLY